MRRLASRLGKLVAPRDVIALVGPLGAGKTLFVKGLALGMGVPKSTRVTSPTFNLVLEYQARLPLYHVDLYRIGQESELAELGLDHYLHGDGVCAVEWFDKFPALWPRELLRIDFSGAGAGARQLSITGQGPRGAALAAAWFPKVKEAR
jgi:tRNA threonylcarbamoyladenosine biosynthesis protein TsaE